MNLVHYIKLILKYTRWLVILPIVCAVTVFFLTRKSKKQYTSSTTLYTGVASGYSITSTGDDRLDYFAVNNAFDNLLASAKSREAMQEVALHLLAEHLVLTRPDNTVLGAVGFENLKKLTGDALMAKARQLKDAQSVYNYIAQLYSSQSDNVINNILNKPGSFYSIDDLKANLVVTRINTSDMLQVVYTTTDPAVCLRVLQLHTNIFTARYKQLKSDQTFSAVQYFENKLAEAKGKLETSEDELKVFGQKNRVINYYEQTRYVAQAKEQLDKEIYGEKVTQKGAKTALAHVEQKLSSRDSQVENGLSLINLRERLSAVNADLEKAVVYNDKSKVKSLTARANQLSDSLKAASNQYLNLNYTPEAVPRPSLIQEWVDNSVSTQKSTAGLDVLNKQKQNYLNEMDELAPLGSTLKRLDRQVDINEKEYLAVLNGLHLAKLRQSNLSLSSNIVVQDKPYFPRQPLASTRALLIALSFFVGLIGVISVVVGRELMDSSVRSPERAKKLINLPLAGATMHMPAKELGYHYSLRNQLIEQLAGNILPYLTDAVNQQSNAQLSLLSFKTDTLHATDVRMLHEVLSSIYGSVCWVAPQNCPGVLNAGLSSTALFVYKPSIALVASKNIGQLAGADLQSFQLVIYVAANLAQSGLPAAVIKQSAVALLAFNAQDAWLPLHKENLSKLKSDIAGVPLLSWLTNAEENDLDQVVGEIPKKRSWLRKKIKSLITLNLK